MSQTKNTVLFQSLADLNAKTPLADISIAELTTAAGVSRMYFYRNFKTYDEIIDQHINDLVTDFIRAVRKRSSSVESNATLFFKILEPDASAFGAFLAHNESNHIQRNFELGLQRLLEQELIQGQADPYWEAYTAGGLSRVITVWLSKPARETPQQMGAKIAAIVH